MPRAGLLLLFLAIGLLPSLAGVLFPPGAWYAELAKPAWTPPAWVFGPVWTVLYLTIGVAGYLAWTASAPGQRRGPFLVYGAQLTLNALWSALFFGLHSPGLALADLTALWVLILVNMVVFHRIRPAAGLLLLPYLLWVSFAGALNLAIVRLN